MSLTISTNRTEGYSKATKFEFSVDSDSISNVQYIKWFLGDNNVKVGRSIEHYYQTYGNFDVDCFVYTISSTLSATKNINVKNYVNESIYFNFVPPASFAGYYNVRPFRLNITSTSTEPHIVDLYAQFSRSNPPQIPQNKWSFLRPEWRFLDLNGNVIENLETIDTELKIDENGEISPNGLTVGVSGYADFYFVDDIYNFDLNLAGEPYTTLIATLRTEDIDDAQLIKNQRTYLPNASNSLAQAILPYTINANYPDDVKITKNGIYKYENFSWYDAQQPIIVSLNNKESLKNEWTNVEIPKYDEEANFVKYFPLDTNQTFPIDLVVLGLSSNIINTPVEFKEYDDNNHKIGGYWKGEFEVANTILNSSITASGEVYFNNISGNLFNPSFWVSNPAAGMIGNVNYYYQNSLYQISSKNLPIAQCNSFEIPIITEPDFDSSPTALSGFHGVNSFAVLPLPEGDVWATDSETDTIYRFSSIGEVLCSIDLKSVLNANGLPYPIQNKVSPVSITLDGDKNFWVTLYDTVSTLKFDKWGSFLLATTPLSSTGYVVPPNINSNWFSDTSYYPTISSVDGENNFIEPTGLDTDSENNVWVSYSYFGSGYVIKYNQNGGLLQTINYPICACPQELVVDDVDNIWVCCANTIWNSLGYIEKRNSNGLLLSTFKINSPNHINIDYNQNLWFTFEYDKVGFINNATSQLQIITGCSLPSSDAYTYWFTENVDDSILTGIACNLKNQIFVLNGLENNVYVIDGNSKNIQNKFTINPKGFNFYQNAAFEPTDVVFNPNNKSLQAKEDWTGFRWINKYSDFRTNSLTYTVTGTTERIDFYNENPYDIFKVNENFDLAAYMKSFAFMPTLQNSPFLFDEFLGSIFGKAPFEHDDIGLKLYEGIANFLSNHKDVDLCDISSLYDLAQQVDQDSDDFLLNYPPDVKRLINLISVNQKRLMGVKCRCGTFNKNYDCSPTSTCSYCGKPKKGNRGNLITSIYYNITAGIPVILKEKSLNKYTLIPTGELYNQSNYHLQDLVDNLKLPANWKNYYEFYEFYDDTTNTVIDNLIDWENPQTTLNFELSSKDYYNDIFTINLSEALYKGLQFF